jgi:uncharacterized protein YbaA (DUF1428 family)
MAHHVDGFVIPLPRKNVGDYRRMAQKAGKVWRDHGALEFRECVGEDSGQQNRKAVYARNQNQARRDGIVLLHRVQVARSP